MSIKNKKGLTIVELVLAVAVMALVLPLVTQVFLYGLKDYMSGTKYLMQQSDLNSFFNVFRYDFEMGRDLYFPPNQAGDTIQGQPVPMDYLKYVVVRYDPASPECELEPPAYPNQYQEERFCRRYEFKEIGEIDDDVIDPATGALGKVKYGELRVAYVSSFDHTENPPNSQYRTLLRNVDLTYRNNNLRSGIFYNDVQKKAWFKISLVKVSLLDDTANVNRSIDKPLLLYFDYPNKNTDFD